MSETNEGWFLMIFYYRGSGLSPENSDVFHQFNVEFVTKIEIKTRIFKIRFAWLLMHDKLSKLTRKLVQEMYNKLKYLLLVVH